MPNIEDIFNGKNVTVPKATDELYALASSIVAYARERRNDMNKIRNSIVFATRLPVDFSVIILKDYMYLEDGYKEKLLRIPEFTRWVAEKGRLLNGNI